MIIYIGNEYVRSLSISPRIDRRLQQPIVFPPIAGRPQHHHPISQSQLRVNNAPEAIRNHQMPGKPKGPAKPLNSGGRIPVAQRRDYVAFRSTVHQTP